jgi:hypothetical protein
LKQTGKVATNSSAGAGGFKFKTDFNFGFIDEDSSLNEEEEDDEEFKQEVEYHSEAVGIKNEPRVTEMTV